LPIATIIKKRVTRATGQALQAGSIGSIVFLVSGRNREIAISLSAEKTKEAMVLLPNVHVASSLCFYSQMNSLEEGLWI